MNLITRFIQKNICLFFKKNSNKYYYSCEQILFRIYFFLVLIFYIPKPITSKKLGTRERYHFSILQKIISKNYLQKKITVVNFGAGNTYIDKILHSKFKNINSIIIDPKFDRTYYQGIKNIKFFRNIKDLQKKKIEVDIFYGSHIINVLPNLFKNLDYINMLLKKGSHVALEYPIFQNQKELDQKKYTFCFYYFKYNFYKLLKKKLKSNIKLKTRITIQKKDQNLINHEFIVLKKN
jgi:hypothetical protein